MPKERKLDIGAIFDGLPVRIEYRAHIRDTAGNEAHAATFIPQRLIKLDPQLKRDSLEHRRILFHECLHFTWLRIGNQRRWRWEALLRAELNRNAKGEAGWSAEWRKQRLTNTDLAARSRRWREYCCESFCDTGAWLLASPTAEMTLSPRYQSRRRAWFEAEFGGNRLPF